MTIVGNLVFLQKGNYAWIEHMISKLAPNGTAGFVLANGSMSTSEKMN